MKPIYDEKFIIGLIKQDDWMMRALETAKKMNLPDWWLAAGFIRNKVWDSLHKYKARTTGGKIDVDFIYFEPLNLRPEVDKSLEIKLLKQMPEVPWSVSNQARMHLYTGEEPHFSSIDAVSKWPEISTCVAVKMDDWGNVVLGAPLGVEDVVKMVVRPNPRCERNPQVFKERMRQKDWQKRLPKVKVLL